ncbi:CGNR zinc finger domain-containing protein [Dongia rigui]|uniref:CGNR zinc finger domain-containing protein n=1 Tax=Dongia rigui TaxID=940149 RepID=A0ABU5DX80_9PROT|nr:CGNR zinc finger domain-containing protein [Dongia rigui]MDY0871922.1 CGNR zinc finger domain-containing protein [Dongia rigui]
MSQIDSPNVIPPFASPLPARVPKSEFVAGRLSLAFCNTVALPDAADRLGDAAALMGWADRAGFKAFAPPAPDVFTGLLEVREILRVIFTALATGRAPDAAALDRLAALAPPLHLSWNDAENRAEPQPQDLDPLGSLRDAIVRDAIALLTGPDVIRIKQCPAEDCRWFFFDTSKNGKRRWCAMSDCGVKAKVNRYRGRHMAAF